MIVVPSYRCDLIRKRSFIATEVTGDTEKTVTVTGKYFEHPLF